MLVRGIMAGALSCAIASTPMRSFGAICEPGKGYVAADVSEQINAGFAQRLATTGIHTIIRYYDHPDETLPGKTLTARELTHIANAGLSVAVIFQHHNDRVETFLTLGRGRRDALRSLDLARSHAQPKGSAIYFGVDLEGPPRAGIAKSGFVETHVDRYFREVTGVLRESGYKIGAYGSGAVCEHLLGEQLIDYCWLANATGWSGYRKFENSNRWVLKQHRPTHRRNCFGIEVDLNTGNPRVTDFGQWQPKRS